MDWIRSVILWFSGGATQYCNLRHCMQHDTFWIVTTVTLDVAVALGYAVIAYHWHTNERSLPPSPARRALVTMRNIFTFCGVCGYLFIPVKLVWPAWRLYDLVMVGLVFNTWRYALNTKRLKVLYTAVGRADQLETELTDARNESRRKGAFLNAISHDLRTPLNGLMLHAHLAELHVGEGEPSRAAVIESLSEIKSAARLTADLLDGLLEYARLEGSEDKVFLTEFPLAGVVLDVLTTFNHEAAQKGVEVTADVSPALIVKADRLKLERVLNNLVGNGVKYTPAGSVRVTAESAGADLEVHVTDTGVGIAAEHVGRLFDEFYQVENHERDRQKGFGLGLAIGRRLARQLGGDLAVASVPGRGSRFTILLPGIIAHHAPGTGVARDGGTAQGADGLQGDRGVDPSHGSGFGRPAGVAGGG
jgi:signal transduction histidine kinase